MKTTGFIASGIVVYSFKFSGILKPKIRCSLLTTPVIPVPKLIRTSSSLALTCFLMMFFAL